MITHFSDPKQVLVELALSIAGDRKTSGGNLDSFLNFCMPLFVEKLECSGASVFRETPTGYQSVYTSGPCDLQEFLLSDEAGILIRTMKESGVVWHCHSIGEETHYYLFILEGFGLLILSSNAMLEDQFANSLAPVITLLAHACFYHLNGNYGSIGEVEIAQSINLAKVRFMSNVGHEIYTPLNVIIGMLSLLRESNLDDHQLKLLTSITVASDNLLTQVNDILDYRTIDTGELELKMGVFNIHDLFRRLFDANEYKADNKNLLLKYHTESSLPQALIGDSLRLMQVINNILNNAIKFTQKGTIDFYCHLSETAGNKFKILFCVEDTGIGISPKNLEKIFDSFQQEDDSFAKSYGGMGLGLTMSSKLVNLMGGKLEARSIKNSGSSFFFTLELERDLSVESTKDHSEVIREAPTLPGRKLLLVEDNEFNQYFTMAILESWGAVCTIAENGQKAIDLARTEKFDLILMDIQMPVMDGFTSATYMRNNLKITTPILALTASVVKGVTEPFLKAGMQGCITKPFEPYELFCKIKEILPPQDEIMIQVPEEEENINLMDLSSLSKMVGNDPVKINRMVEKFLEVTPADVDELANQAKSKNIEAISHTSHKLKSSIGLVSNDTMRDLIRTINEKSAAAQDDEALYNMIQKFLKYFPGLMKQMKDLF